MDDVLFTSASFVLCSLAAVIETFHQPQTWVSSDVWNNGELSPLHLLLAVFTMASCTYWLIPPGLYDGVLAGPSLILLPIAALTAFAGLPHLLLWTVMLHHAPDVLLGLLHVVLWRGRDASPARQALAGLCLFALLPLWFVTRVYWYSQLLSPHFLKPLPDSVVVTGLVVHVLLWILGAINLRNYWRLVQHCWRYLAGDLEELGRVFDAAPPATATGSGQHRQPRPPAHVNKHQKNMKLIYHTIRMMTRLRRKIRRRRAAKAAATEAAAAAAAAAAAEGKDQASESDTGD